MCGKVECGHKFTCDYIKWHRLGNSLSWEVIWISKLHLIYQAKLVLLTLGNHPDFLYSILLYKKIISVSHCGTTHKGSYPEFSLGKTNWICKEELLLLPKPWKHFKENKIKNKSFLVPNLHVILCYFLWSSKKAIMHFPFLVCKPRLIQHIMLLQGRIDSIFHIVEFTQVCMGRRNRCVDKCSFI